MPGKRMLHLSKEVGNLYVCRISLKVIVFSKFCELRHKHSILVGTPGTQTVRVCTHTLYQDVELMASRIKLEDLTSNMNLETDTLIYSYCLALMICNPTSEKCFFGGLTVCPREGFVQKTLQEVLNDSIIDVFTCR
jgi:hypothetical protein